MAEELGLSDYATIHELGGFNTAQKTTSRKTEQSERKLLRIGILTLGVLCIIQATLNISLRAAFYSKEDVDQFSFNVSVIADLCQMEQSQQNSTELCCCCNDLLRKLLREYQNLKTERDFLLDKLSELSKTTIEGADFQGSGSGSGFLEDNYS